MLAFALAAVTIAAFWQVSSCEFLLYDDNFFVTANPNVTAGLTVRGVLWALRTMYGANWHPLTWLSYMGDVSLFGLNPAGHHLTSLAIHLASTIVLFLGLAAMTGNLRRSAIVAALFGVHPLRVESVAWIAGRGGILCGFFWMLAMLAYVRYARRPNVGKYLQVVILFSMGLLAKAMIVTFPFVLLLLDYWPLGRWQPRVPGFRGRAARLVLEKMPLILLTAAGSAVAFLAERETGAVRYLAELPLAARMSNAASAYGAYAWKTLWPADLSIAYRSVDMGTPAWVVACSGAFLIGASVIAVLAARRRPFLTVGWLWYLGTLLPVIGIVQIMTQAIADRYTYLPAIGLSIAVVWSVADAVSCRRWANRLVTACACLLVLALVWRTSKQVGYWQNGVTLFAHAVAVSPESWTAHNELGNALVQQGRPDEASPHLQQAFELNPSFRAEVLFKTGNSLALEGRYGEARVSYSRALQLLPSYMVLQRASVEKAIESVTVAEQIMINMQKRD